MARRPPDARKRADDAPIPRSTLECFGIEENPELPLAQSTIEVAQAFGRDQGLNERELVIGLGTGAGGRWTSKGLPTERVVSYAGALATTLGWPCTFLVLGGPPGSGRSDEIIGGINGLGTKASAVAMPGNGQRHPDVRGPRGTLRSDAHERLARPAHRPRRGHPGGGLLRATSATRRSALRARRER